MPARPLIDRDRESLLPTYDRVPIEIVRGEGVHLWDADGKRYLDCVAGLGVNALGYAHPRIAAAVARQMEAYTHISNAYPQQPQVELAERLRAASGCARVFFCNSGTEAMEAAFKLARRRGAQQGKTVVFGFTGGFHGRTMAPLSVMSQERYRAGFGPFLPDCRTLPFNDVQALETAIGPDTCAVVVECIQGEGGLHCLTPDCAVALGRLRDRHGFLLIADEVQAGLCRTGRVFSYEHWTLRPDLVLLAKALGGGLPLGALLVGGDAADVLGPGSHGSTFGGNPVACAAGCAVLDELFERDLAGRADTVGARLADGLRDIVSAYPAVACEARGKGLMAGLALRVDAAPVRDRCRERGLLVNVTSGSVLRFLPPLMFSENDVDDALDMLRGALDMPRGALDLPGDAIRASSTTS